ncbi:hypothetical protein [Agrobacterium rosae]|uniref:Uncharacterized protein n=1 Tax=Agrobacterium rosae TaxID=1972867 RepID=A0AAW9FFR5_9HYPH|nr:hypothetical protein [Agrobacterium rosae]MDX8303278.1 hypothetical protein [Agrobacterium rosae]POO56218.1 hypothetical protein CTT39_05625 [Agrobacterium rosae]
MKTDWNLVRDMLNAAIDTCERIEAAGYTESDRDADIDVNGQAVSVQDFLASAWTASENLRYKIICSRHENDVDLAYVPETARILVAMAQAAAETIGAGEKEPPAADDIRKLVSWFHDHAAPGIERAIEMKRSQALGTTETGR